MKLKFWGTRGSSPVIGVRGAKFRSNHSSCVELISENESLIIDAGSALGEVLRMNYEKGQREYSICMSHFHWDHVLGLISLYDLFYRGIKLKIHSPDANLKKHIMGLFDPAYCPISQEIISKSFEFIPVKQKTKLGSFHVSFSEVPHTGKTYAIEVSTQTQRVQYMSDVSLTQLKAAPFAEAPDLLICDSFHLTAFEEERKDWGHSSAVQAAIYAVKSKAKKLALFHYDPTYSEADLEKLVQEAKSAAPGLDIHATQDGDELVL